MAYHTGVYGKIQPFLTKNLIQTIGDFKVYEWQGRWFLVKNDYKIAQLVNGKESFDKNYKSDFHYWIQKVKDKDEKKVAGIRVKIDRLVHDVNIIESIWK